MKLVVESKFDYAFIVIMVFGIICGIMNAIITDKVEIITIVPCLLLTNYLYRNLKFNHLNQVLEDNLRMRIEAKMMSSFRLILVIMMGFSYFIKENINIDLWLVFGILIMVVEISMLVLYIISGLKRD